jgi:hypothetical protein
MPMSTVLTLRVQLKQNRCRLHVQASTGSSTDRVNGKISFRRRTEEVYKMDHALPALTDASPPVLEQNLPLQHYELWADDS